MYDFRSVKWVKLDLWEEYSYMYYIYIYRMKIQLGKSAFALQICCRVPRKDDKLSDFALNLSKQTKMEGVLIL